MFISNNDIIVIDDEQSSLDEISRVFNKYGVPCRTILYDAIGCPIAQPLLGVKLVFLDINYSVEGSVEAVAARLALVIKQCISVENNPFVIVLWTTTQDDDIQPYIDYLKRPSVSAELPRVMNIFSLCKTDFSGKELELEQKLNDITNDALVNCLYSFSSVVKHTADKAFSEMVGLVDFNDGWGEHEQYEEDLKNFFSKLAVDTYGCKNGKKHPDNAIMEVLSSIFMYRLMNDDSKNFEEFLQLEASPYDQLYDFPKDSISARLNTMLHIDMHINDAKNRGAVIEIDLNNKGIRNQFKNKFNYSPFDWGKSCFIIDETHPLNWRLVAVEMSALCDYTNGKIRSHRYLLGILCKREVWDSHKVALKEDNIRLGSAIYEMEFDFLFSGEKYVLVWNLGFVFNDEQIGPVQVLGEVLFTLKTDAVNAISIKFANHMSRFGYNHF